MSNYSSLFEVGIGLGVGLSLFRIPIDAKKLALTRQVEMQLKLHKHQSTAAAERIYVKYADLAIRLDDSIERLESQVNDFEFVILFDVLVNIVILVYVANHAESPVSLAMEIFFLFVSFGWYAIVGLVILIMTERSLGAIEREMRIRDVSTIG